MEQEQLLTCAGPVVVVQLEAGSAGAVKASDVVVAEVITHTLPVHPGHTLVYVCQRSEVRVLMRLRLRGRGIKGFLSHGII